MVRDTYAVKYGAFAQEYEGYALIFAEKYLNIPAPRLYAMCREPIMGNLYLVMEHIRGVSLESVWGTLATEAKLSIATQLKTIFDSMRALSPPPAYVGSISGGDTYGPVFFTMQPNADIDGPFETTDAFSRAMALASQGFWSSHGKQNWTSEFFSRHLATALKGHTVKYSHGDLCMQNVIVEQAKDELDYPAQTNGATTWKVKGIVGWKAAGWYPAYWEYATAMARGHSEIDWPETIDTVLTPFPMEFAMIHLLYRNMRLVN